jgi:polar amino acid transport system substrate-binding protein
MRRTRWLYDLGAIALVLGYIWLANRTEGGAADPVWRRVQERGVMRVGTDIGFVPFVAGQPDGSLSGYDVDLVTEIARRLGWRVEWRQVGYDALFSAIDGSNPNQVDLLAAGILQNPGEAWRARFSTAYFDGGQQLLVGPDSALVSQADLHGQRIAVQLGSPAETAARHIAAADPTITIINSAETQAGAVELLLAGAADAAVVDNASALPFIHRGQVRQAGGLTYEPIVLATPAAAYQLSAEINRVIAELQQEGWIAELNQRWFR